VVAKEIDPPAGSTPVEWRLLTNRTAETLAQAAELIDWYRARWEIGILFHILKNGCRIESLQLRTIDGLQRAIALYLIFPTFCSAIIVPPGPLGLLLLLYDRVHVHPTDENEQQGDR
jgi:hypothetical protein